MTNLKPNFTSAALSLFTQLKRLSLLTLCLSPLTALAHLEKNIDLTVIGPEDPLVLGITDKFKSLGLNCFGPSMEAAQLEGSKEFMKDFLIRHNIPTGTFQSFTNAESAIAHIKSIGCPLVIKADGLAAGKGVTVALEEKEDD